MDVIARMKRHTSDPKVDIDNSPRSAPTKPVDGLPAILAPAPEPSNNYKTAGGASVRFRLDDASFNAARGGASREQIELHLTLAHLHLLRGFDQLFCLEGLQGVEHLPHQIETVRKVLRRFRGRVLLADEVGLGKTIEACLLLREYILRGQVRRVLILVPNPLVSQWHEELSSKFQLEFTIPPRTVTSDRAEFWELHDRILVSTSFAKSGKRPEAITQARLVLARATQLGLVAGLRILGLSAPERM